MDFLLITMITNKLTALMLAVGMLAVVGLVASPMVAMAQPVNVAAALNEDNDVVIHDNDVIGVTGSNVAANDCDSTQNAAIDQSNTNTDNDVQVASADSCQQIA